MVARGIGGANIAMTPASVNAVTQVVATELPASSEIDHHSRQFGRPLGNTGLIRQINGRTSCANFISHLCVLWRAASCLLILLHLPRRNPARKDTERVFGYARKITRQNSVLPRALASFRNACGTDAGLRAMGPIADI
jgi:hypothetical protein